MPCAQAVVRKGPRVLLATMHGQGAAERQLCADMQVRREGA